MKPIIKNGLYATLVPLTTAYLYLVFQNTTNNFLTKLFLIIIYPLSAKILESKISATSLDPLTGILYLIINILIWTLIGIIIAAIYEKIKNKQPPALEPVTNSRLLIKKY